LSITYAFALSKDINIRAELARANCESVDFNDAGSV